MDIIEKIWWIAVKGESEGPYSYLDLERDERVTPETFIWKEGWQEWQRLKDIEELESLFNEKNKQNNEPKEDKDENVLEDEELAIEPMIPPWIFFWIIAIILTVLYLWQLFRT